MSQNQSNACVRGQSEYNGDTSRSCRTGNQRFYQPQLLLYKRKVEGMFDSSFQHSLAPVVSHVDTVKMCTSGSICKLIGNLLPSEINYYSSCFTNYFTILSWLTCSPNEIIVVSVQK